MKTFIRGWEYKPPALQDFVGLVLILALIGTIVFKGRPVEDVLVGVFVLCCIVYGRDQPHGLETHDAASGGCWSPLSWSPLSSIMSWPRRSHMLRGVRSTGSSSSGTSPSASIFGRIGGTPNLRTAAYNRRDNSSVIVPGPTRRPSVASLQ